MTKTRQTRLYLISLGVYALLLALLYPFLPASVAMQVNLSGEANWSLPKLGACAFFLGFQGLVALYAYVRYKEEAVYPAKILLAPYLLMGVSLISLIVPLFA